jgi:type VI secretion system protein ImpL
MKKIPLWQIILWCVLFFIGLFLIIISSIFNLNFFLKLAFGIVFCGTSIIWALIGIILLLTKKKKKKASFFIENRGVFEKINRETQEAVNRYFDAVVRKGLLKKSALYERPWFLLCGTEKSGKTSLLKGAGLNFPLRYPSERDGIVLEGSDQITWFFANEAVWIDTPGSIMTEEKKAIWQALINSLLQVRTQKPIDGIACVVSAAELLESDEKTVKEKAGLLRSRIDELIALWGIEFPVYLIFNQSDKIPGFNEYFGEQLAKTREQIFGATISIDQDKLLPRMVFKEEFKLLSNSLTDVRLDKLIKEKDPARKRMICRFVIHFEAIQEKLGIFVAELFKPSNYEGKPLFRGFYFTSCKEVIHKEALEEKSIRMDAGATIAGHFLNPHKLNINQPQKTSDSTQITSMFVLPLFNEIMVKGKELVKTTQKRTRREYARNIIITLSVLIFTCVILLFMVKGMQQSITLFKLVKTEISNMPDNNISLIDQYNTLEVIGKNISMLQKYEDKGAPFLMRIFGFYKGSAILEDLRKLYFNKVARLIVTPASKYLEYAIWEKAQSYGELAGEEYDNLYNNLKAYLMISEAMKGMQKEIDTVFLKPILLYGIKSAILSAQGVSDRLPKQTEAIIIENVGIYLMYLKRGIAPTIQGNQRLITAARANLRRLPSPKSLYDAVINRLDQEAPKINLDDILNRQQEGILKSDKTISVLYTQEGWDKYVCEALKQTAKNPFKIDWVIGLSEKDFPEESLDKKKLYDDMLRAYTEDFEKKWLDFVESVNIEPFGDLSRSQRILQKLVAEKSELAILLETIANYTVLKKESMAEKYGGEALNQASKFKAVQSLKGTLDKAEQTAQKVEETFSLGKRSPIDELNSTFDPLRSFARSTGGSLSGYEGYKDKLLTLAEKISSIETNGTEYALTVFSGKDDDPLLNCWKYTQSVLTNFPQKLSDALKNLLLLPIIHTGDAASMVLTKVINDKWQTEVVKTYTNRFSGKYPFYARGDDASFNDVMDFFRPQTGTFWGFYERVLSPYIVKVNSEWMVRKVGSIAISFNPKLGLSLSSAERIRDIFFKPDGTLRTISLTITPSSSNKNNAKMEVNGQVIELLPGGKSMTINWPIESSNLGASLKVYVSQDFSQDISYSGQWGFLKLMNAAKINKINNSMFTAKWQINVQNMYMIYLEYKFQVSGADHPFNESVFSNFDCPVEIILSESKK